MSSLLIDPIETRARQQQLAGTPTDYDALAPGTFEGLPSGLAQGMSRAGATVSALGSRLLPYNPTAQGLRIVDAFSGKDSFTEAKDLSRAWIDESRLDPATHGAVSNVLYGVASQAPAIAAMFVNPVLGAGLASGTTFEGTGADLQSAGVDAQTAQGAAAIDAALAGIGAFLPGSIGTRRALNTLLVGPGINVAQDLASRYAIATQLEANGYGEMAEQYRHLDAATLIADVVIGAGFGYAGAKFTRAQKEAALVQQQSRAAILAGPGAPVDLASQAKHAAALVKATDDLAAGRPVDVSGIDGATFLRDPQMALAAVLERSGYHEEAAQIRALETELEARALPRDAEELPVVPRVDLSAAPKAPDAAKVQSATAESAGPKAEPLPPHEQATVDQAETIASEKPSQAAQNAAGEGQPARATIATPAGDVTASRALKAADRELATAEKESVQFDAAASCYLRHGA